MIRRGESSRWWAITFAILCITAVTTLSVITPGLWISHAAQLGGAYEYRTLLTVANGTGTLAMGALACWRPVRVLGVAITAVYTLLMTAALATGELGPALFLPLAIAGGGMKVCVWSLLLQQVSTTERHLRSAAVLLGEIVAGVSYLFALGGLAPLLFAMDARASFALATAEAVLVGLALMGLGAAPPADSGIRLPEGGFARLVAPLLVVAVPAHIAASAMSGRLINPFDVLAFRPWLQAASALVAAGVLLALLLWLSPKSREPTLRVLAVASFCGAGFSLVLLMSVPPLQAGWGVGPAFLVAFGIGIVSFSARLLLVLASVATPPRLVPLLVAGWFVEDTLVSRWVPPLADDARGDAGRTVAVTVVAAALLAIAGLTAWSLAKRDWFKSV
jgi:hypothetical protein